MNILNISLIFFQLNGNKCYKNDVKVPVFSVPSCSCPQGLWLCHQAGLGCRVQFLAQVQLGTALCSALGWLCSALMPWIV